MISWILPGSVIINDRSKAKFPKHLSTLHVSTPNLPSLQTCSPHGLSLLCRPIHHLYSSTHLSLQKRTGPNQIPMHQALLSKLGSKCNIKLIVVYGSRSIGCIGCISLYVEQATGMLLLAIRHIRAGTDQGTVLLIAYKWWQSFSRMDLPLLDYPDQLCQHLSHDWFRSLMFFLQ